MNQRRRGARLPRGRRLGELERYGLLALCGTLVLGCGYLVEALRLERTSVTAASYRLATPGYEVSRATADSSASPGAEQNERPGGGVRSRSSGARTDFDFFEPPVRLPGRAAPNVPPPDLVLQKSRLVVVQGGDTLQKIAERELGSAAEWRRILEANEGVEPRRLHPGQLLAIPEPLPALSSEPGPVRASRERSHVIAKNDTLERISLKHYGTRSRWIDILEANRDLIRSPEKLQLGVRIRIP